MNDAQEPTPPDSPATRPDSPASAGEGSVEIGRSGRAPRPRWSRSLLTSWVFHGVLLMVVGWHWAESRVQPIQGERGAATIEIAQAPDSAPPQEVPNEEPPPEVEPPDVAAEPELIESPEPPPEFPPELLPEPKPLDWLPPVDMFRQVTPFKSKPAPEVESVEPEPRVAPTPVPVEPQVPTVLEGDALPTVLKKEAPVYPRKAIRMRWAGTVILRIQVNAAGEVIDVRVHESSGHESLDEAAVEAFRNWLFQPRKEGDPEVRLLQKPFTFRLE